MQLTDDMRRAIREHADQDAPREACGLIVAGADGPVYVRCRNLSARPDDQFRIAAEDFAAAEDAGEVLAVVHSHHGDTWAPSMADRVSCEASGLPWVITGVDGFGSIEPCGYRAPLLGRPFVHGVLDCWAVIRDWYAQERGIELVNPPRADDWWANGGDLYRELLPGAGFDLVDDEPRPGDLFLMQIRAPVPNHAAVYLGDGVILHHLCGRLSERVVYGGMWAKITTGVWRYARD